MFELPNDGDNKQLASDNRFEDNLDADADPIFKLVESLFEASCTLELIRLARLDLTLTLLVNVLVSLLSVLLLLLLLLLLA